MAPCPSDPHEFEASEPTLAAPAWRPAAASPTAGAGLIDVVFDAMEEVALVVDAAGVLVRGNRALRLAHPWLTVGTDLRALPADLDLFERDGRTLVPRDAWPIHRVLRGETVTGAEYVVVPPGQPPFAFRLNAVPLEADGRPSGALLVAVNVTGRRLAERRFQAMFEASALGIALLDRDGRFVASNPALQRMLGYTAAELATMTAEAVTDPADYARELATRRRLIAGEMDSYEIEVRARARDGRRLTLAKAVFRFPGLLGDDDLALCMAQDITERRQATERLEALEALLDEAERSSRFGCWRIDVRTGQIAWTDGFYRLLGYEPGSVEPSVQAYLDRLHPAQRAALAYGEQEIRDGEVPPVEDHEVLWPDGTERTLRFSGRIERDAAGAPLRVIGVAQDVTEKVRTERAKADFLAVVSHEMRTPLTVIRAPLLMVQRGQLDPRTDQGRMLLDLAVQGVERMTRLVDDIHDLQRLESGKLTMRPVPVAAADVVAGATDAMAPIAREAGVAIVAEVAADAAGLAVRADQDRIVQVLTNLIENAIKYSPGGGTVRVALARRDGEALFAVSDEGPGIPEDQRQAVFERYVQLGAKSVRPSSGIGLGLAIAQDIVAYHGGTIWVDARPGGGSVFCFTLPLAAGLADTEAPGIEGP